MWSVAQEQYTDRAAEKAGLQKVLPVDLLEKEPAAAMRRWLGYRFKSPLECTQQFARDYNDAFYFVFGVRCEFDPLPGSEEFVVLWRMRQSADQWPVPYPLYLEVCFSFNRRNADKFRRPHMHFDRLSKSISWSKKLHAAIRERGSSMLTRLSDMPQFHREHYVGLPAQDSFRGYARHLARSTKQWLHIASSICITHYMVPLAIVLSDLKEPDLRSDVVERLREEVKSGYLSREPATDLGDASLLQSCFGWQRENASAQQPCTRCPQAADCRAAAAAASSMYLEAEVTCRELGGHPSHPHPTSHPT